jgi:RimJ/RimL family protein N-acetyltransferase
MIELKEFTKLDYGRLISWINSEHLMYVFAAKVFEFPITNSQLDNYTSNANRKVYKIIDKNSKEVIGHAELNNSDLSNKSARICRVLIGDVKHRHKGYGSLIIKELVRIDLGVYDFNKNAIKCYQKCGFEIEGLLKENIKIGNEYWSTYNMSILNNK